MAVQRIQGRQIDDKSLTGLQVEDGSLAKAQLSAGVGASLDLADSAVQLLEGTEFSLSKIGTTYTLSLATSGVVAGEYTKLTVDSKGRVTFGDSPTTLAGYGIGDAAPLSHVGTGGGAHAEATLSVAGFLSASDKTKLDGITAGSQPNQNAFTTVAISGQPSVVADMVSDTLTLAAGTAVNLTTNETTDTVTIGVNLGTASTQAAAGDHTHTLTFGSDVSGTGSSSSTINLTLANTTVDPGTYTKLTVDAKGRATTGASLLAGDLPSHSHVWGDLSGTPNTLAGYGITNGLSTATTFATAAAQDATIGGTYNELTLTLVNTGSAGTYRSVTTDAKGRVTAGSNPDTLAGYGITDAAPISHVSAINDVHSQIVDASVPGAGWYRVAQITSSAGRGDAIFSIYTVGGSYTPQSLVIKYHSDWGGGASLIADAMTGLNHWSDVRATVDGGLYFVEVYFTGVRAFKMQKIQASGYSVPTTLFAGELSVGNGSVLEQIDLRIGLNVSNSIQASEIYIANARKDLNWDAAYTATNASTDLNTPSTIVARDGSGNFSAGVITLAVDPTLAMHAVTKQYADAIKQGLDIKDSVRVATTANITLSGTQTIDGVAVIAGNRILVKNQNTAADNGIYVVAAGAWTRAIDADTNTKVTPGMYCFVEEGTAGANHGFVLTTTGTIVLGSTALVFTQFSGAGSITAGDGLTKSGNTISANFTGSGGDSGTAITVARGDHTHAFSALSGKPVTLAGYGITDALNLAGGTLSGHLSVPSLRIGTSGLVEREFMITFPNGAADQKADIYFDRFWGAMEITLGSGYSDANAAGLIRKQYALGLNPANAISTNVGVYTDIGGATATHWALSDVTWDAVASRYRIQVVHRTSTGNSAWVRIRAWGLGVAQGDAILAAGVTAVYTTDTTVFSTPAVPSTLAWNSGNDGAGSGLDADLLRGLASASTNIESTVVTRDGSGNFAAGTITATLTGNASTATNLAVSKNINGVAFNGSSDITITANTTNTLTIGTGLSGTSFNGSGPVTIAIDSTVATLTGAQALTNKTLTTPKVGTSILDTAGNILFALTATGSAVNYLTYANAAAGADPTFSATGASADIDINFVPKGTGRLQVGGINVPTISSTDILSNKTLATPTVTGLMSGSSASFSSTVGATQFNSTVSTGTAPLTVNSTTLVTNLNANLLGGYQASNLPLTAAAAQEVVLGGTLSSATATLAITGVDAGTYRSVTVDTKGRVTDGTNPDTLSGYGITNAVENTAGVPSISSGLFANIPVAGVAGRLYISTDTQVLYRDSGAIWQELGLPAEVLILTKEQSFTASSDQSLFTLTEGAYVTGAKHLQVYIEGVRQHPSAYTETSGTSFTLSEGVPAGTSVFAAWLQAAPYALAAHAPTHAPGGDDPLDSYYAEVGRTLTASTGLTGGGDLSADRSFALTGQALALHNLTTPGMIARTGAGTVAGRTLTPGSAKISISNGDGVSGNPTIDVVEASLTLTAIGGTLTVAKGGTGAVTLTGYVKGAGTAALTASATIPGSDIAGNIPGNAANVTGTVAVANGGTGLTSYAVGDLLYASGSTTLNKLAGIATGNALISGGVTTAPTWGKIGLATHVSGILPIVNGGTNTNTTPTAGKIAYGTGAAYGFSSVGSIGQALVSGGSGAPNWHTVDSANIPSAIVTRDGFGNFIAGAITATLSGNASTATTLAEARSIAISGKVTGTATNFNGGSNITINTTAVTLMEADIPGLSAAKITSGLLVIARGGTNGNAAPTAGAIAYGTGSAYAFSTIGTSGQALISNQSGAPTWKSVASTSVDLAIVSRDVDGNFAANIITGMLAGNASTATTLEDARTINGISFNGSANINIGSLYDTNGNQSLSTVTVAAAVNRLDVSNAATGGSVAINTAGSDANINLVISTKGTGSITLDTGTGAGVIDLKPGASNVRIWDDDSSHYYQIVTGNRTANYSLTLPAANVTLVSGTMVPTARTVTINGTAGQIASSGAQDLSVNRTWTLSLIDAGTPGTYTKVITDAKGRVTSGTNPDTLSGMGITDGVQNISSTVPSMEAGLDASKPAAGTAGRIWIATDTNKIYRDSGVLWEAIGSGVGAEDTLVLLKSQTLVATGGQTLFTLTLGSYTTSANQLQVYVDGIRQHTGALTETSSTSFTLSEGVPAGTSVYAFWYQMAPYGLAQHASAHAPGGDDALDATYALRARAINSGTGLTGGGDLSTDRTLALDGQALALHNLVTSGLIARTGAGTVAGRILTPGSSKLSVTFGDGISGNPTMDVVEANLTLNSIGGTLGGNKGGTGQTSYAIGDILYASAATVLSKLAGVATGNVLISGGVTTAPSWGKVGLTTHISGTLGVTNGGTGLASVAAGSLLYASSANALIATAPSANNQVFRSSAASAAAWGALIAADIPSLDAEKITTGSFVAARVPFVASRDTRNTNDEPDDFNSGIKFDFKLNSTNGLSDGGTYNGVMTWRRYGTGTDFSGGHPIQIAYTDNGNLWQRMGTGAATWGTWTKLKAGTADTLATGRTIAISGKVTGTATTFDGSGNITINTTAATLLAGDIPNLDTAKLTSGTLGIVRGGTGLATVAAGSILYATALNTLTATAPSGANQVLRSTEANALQFAALVAADIPSIDTSKLTSGTLPIARGGTNSTAAATAGGITYGASGAYAFTSAGALGQALISGAANAPTWQTVAAANTASAIVARDGSGNFAAGTITAALVGNASTVTNGVYTTGDQAIGGVKTFSGSIISAAGNAVASLDITAKNGAGSVTNRIRFGSAQGMAVPGNSDQYELAYFITTGIAGRKFFLKADGVGTINLVTDLVTATTFTGALAGNAATVTTNANLTGHVTSVGNSAVLGSFTLAQLNTAVSDAILVSLGGTETITGVKTFGGAGAVGRLKIAGSTSGATTLDAAAVAGAGTVTLPTTGTLATLAGVEVLAGKTLTTPVLGVATATSINKVALTAPATGSTLTIADGKTLTASNTLTLTGTDGSTLAIGTGGTLGTAAYTDSSAYATAGQVNATHTGDATGATVLTVVGINGVLLSSLLTGLLKNATGTGIPSIATAGTDYSLGTSALATGILKSTTATGALSIALAGDFPTLNQSTTGSAATLSTTRSIYGNNFDGSAALAQVIASTFGGTGNGFTKFSGPTTTEKTFTLPDASATILTSNALVTIAQGGTAGNATPTAGALAYGTGAAYAFNLAGVLGQAVISGGAGAPTYQNVASAATASAIVARDASGHFEAERITAKTGFRLNSGATPKFDIVYNAATESLDFNYVG